MYAFIVHLVTSNTIVQPNGQNVNTSLCIFVHKSLHIVILYLLAKEITMKYNELQKKIKEQIGFEPRQTDFCKILDLSRQAMSNRVKNNLEFPLEEITKIEEKYAIKLTDFGNEVTLDYFTNIYASCGNGCIAANETSEKISVTRETIPAYNKNDEYCVINIKGSSMFPALCDGDKAIIKLCADEQIIDDRIYVFSYKNELFVKRLVKNIDEVIAISENKDFGRRPLNDINELHIIGRVVASIRSF